jgi:hypothetical protein
VTTFAHFSVSSAITLPNPVTMPVNGPLPRRIANPLH